MEVRIVLSEFINDKVKRELLLPKGTKIHRVDGLFPLAEYEFISYREDINQMECSKRIQNLFRYSFECSHHFYILHKIEI